MCYCGVVGRFRCHICLVRRVSIVSNIIVCWSMCKGGCVGGVGGYIVVMFKRFSVMFHVSVRVLVIVHYYV